VIMLLAKHYDGVLCARRVEFGGSQNR